MHFESRRHPQLGLIPVILRLLVLAPSFYVDGACLTTQFSCGNGRCVRLELHCDGYDDCWDNLDEYNCSCWLGQFTCVDGGCIPSTSQCDGLVDCNDGSDEINCAGLSLSTTVTVRTTTTIPNTNTSLLSSASFSSTQQVAAADPSSDMSSSSVGSPSTTVASTTTTSAATITTTLSTNPPSVPSSLSTQLPPATVSTSGPIVLSSSAAGDGASLPSTTTSTSAAIPTREGQSTPSTSLSSSSMSPLSFDSQSGLIVNTGPPSSATHQRSSTTTVMTTEPTLGFVEGCLATGPLVLAIIVTVIIAVVICMAIAVIAICCACRRNRSVQSKTTITAPEFAIIHASTNNTKPEKTIDECKLIETGAVKQSSNPSFNEKIFDDKFQQLGLQEYLTLTKLTNCNIYTDLPPLKKWTENISVSFSAPFNKSPALDVDLPKQSLHHNDEPMTQTRVDDNNSVTDSGVGICDDLQSVKSNSCND